LCQDKKVIGVTGAKPLFDSLGINPDETNIPIEIISQVAAQKGMKMYQKWI